MIQGPMISALQQDSLCRGFFRDVQGDHEFRQALMNRVEQFKVIGLNGRVGDQSI